MSRPLSRTEVIAAVCLGAAYASMILAVAALVADNAAAAVEPDHCRFSNCTGDATCPEPQIDNEGRARCGSSMMCRGKPGTSAVCMCTPASKANRDYCKCAE